MPNLVPAAMEQLRSTPSAPDVEEFLGQLIGKDAYQEARRGHITRILGEIAIPDDELRFAVDDIARSELSDPVRFAGERFYNARKAAFEAVLSSTLPGKEKFQLFTEIEGLKPDVNGHENHESAIDFTLKTIPEKARDGLILRLDYTEHDEIENPRYHGQRLLKSATPVHFDVWDPSYFDYERAPEDPSNTRADRPLLSDSSGLYLRHSAAVLSWQQKHDIPATKGVQVYGVHSAAEDIAWSPYGGYAWASSEYPSSGPAVFYGKEAILEFTDRMLTHGGVRLEWIKQQVGDFPGFDFLHEVDATGNPGSDAGNVFVEADKV